MGWPVGAANDISLLTVLQAWIGWETLPYSLKINANLNAKPLTQVVNLES